MDKDEDLVEYLVGIVKEKDKIIEELTFKCQQLVVRESDLREKVEKYEFIYDVPPEDKKQNEFFKIITNEQAEGGNDIVTRLKAERDKLDIGANNGIHDKIEELLA